MKTPSHRSLVVLGVALVSLFLVVGSTQSFNPLSEFGPGKYEVVFAKNKKSKGQEIPGCNPKELHRFHYTCEDDEDEVKGMRLCTNNINKTIESKYLHLFIKIFVSIGYLY